MNKILEIIQRLVKSRGFNLSIFLLIILSAVVVGLETYKGIALVHRETLLLLDRLIIMFFTIEIILKITAKGKRPWDYFTDPWNVFDFIIVGVCLLPLGDTHFFAVLRILRVLRVLRMVSFLPKLRLVINVLLKSLPSMGYVLLLILILFYVYAVIGVFIFGQADPKHFGDLHHALITLFMVLTLEGWIDIISIHIYGPQGGSGQQIVSLWPFLYFSSFILVGAMIIMNLIIGIIMNSMDESRKEMAKENWDNRHAGDSPDELYRQIITRLDELNEEIRSMKKT